MFNNENNNEEITSETIAKYINSIHALSIATGKLDVIMMYVEKTYPCDKFLIQSLDSILNNITCINQDNKYERTILNTEDKAPLINMPKSSTKHDINRYDGTKKVSEVQTPHEDIKVAPMSAEIAQDKGMNTDSPELYYKFINSTNLGEMWYALEAKLLKVKFKGNERLYHYISVPENHIKQMVILDKNKESAGKYFNEIVKKNFEYRETSGEAEEMIG